MVCVAFDCVTGSLFMSSNDKDGVLLLASGLLEASDGSMVMPLIVSLFNLLPGLDGAIVMPLIVLATKLGPSVLQEAFDVLTIVVPHATERTGILKTKKHFVGEIKNSASLTSLVLCHRTECQLSPMFFSFWHAPSQSLSSNPFPYKIFLHRPQFS